MKRWKRACLVLTAALLAGSMADGATVQAQEHYNSYTYDEWEESVAAPASYTPVLIKNGLEIGAGTFDTPQDFFMAQDGRLYVADTNHNRIVVLDHELEYLESIETVIYNGEEIPLAGVEGLYVTEENVLYVSQAAEGRILVVENGVVTNCIVKPDSTLLAEDFVFAPSKIGIDMYGRLYVLSKGCYSGLLQFDTDGSFMGFFGANKVEVTAEVLFNYMWKNILSDEQRAAMTSIIPIEYSNVDCSDDGFVYTSTVGTALPKSQVKKLNPLGNNIYFAEGKREFNFGDAELTFNKGKANMPSFIDVKTDENGFIFAVDLTSCRIFERDQEGNLIAVIGGSGNQAGTFRTPVAVEVYGGKLYVLDSLKNNITVFERTEYGERVEEATVLYNNGHYEESRLVWQEVLDRNANNILAYNGVGKALAQSSEYTEALDYLRYSGDRYSYSRAFGKNRLVLVRQYGIAVVGIICVLSAAAAVWKRFGKRRKKDEKNSR